MDILSCSLFWDLLKIHLIVYATMYLYQITCHKDMLKYKLPLFEHTFPSFLGWCLGGAYGTLWGYWWSSSISAYIIVTKDIYNVQDLKKYWTHWISFRLHLAILESLVHASVYENVRMVLVCCSWCWYTEKLLDLFECEVVQVWCRYTVFNFVVHKRACPIFPHIKITFIEEKKKI